jgi:hypothetical protein
MFNSLCLIVEDLRICYSWTGSPTKFADFADMQFADQSKKKFADSHISEICDCRLSQRICGLKKTVANLPPASTIPLANCHQY